MNNINIAPKYKCGESVKIGDIFIFTASEEKQICISDGTRIGFRRLYQDDRFCHQNFLLFLENDQLIKVKSNN